jgi:oligopeptide/dipeptide ABC transporter ATP-binding protein
VGNDLRQENGVLLSVDTLNVTIETAGRRIALVSDVSFAVGPGEIFVLVGESGSGKTTVMKAVANLFRPNATVVREGRILFEGIDLVAATEKKMRRIRRQFIRYIPQEPSLAFNPVLRIQSQLELAGDREERIMTLLGRLDIEHPVDLLRHYPHQLSVGTLQRILVAAALAPQPRLILADEPTSAVDITLRHEVLALLSGQCRSSGMGLLLTTHDLTIARKYGDVISVLYAGRIVEVAPNEQFFERPYHPYSQALVASVPEEEQTIDEMPSPEVVNQNPARSASGCRFFARCTIARPDCAQHEPPLELLGNGRQVRCPYWK